MDKRLQFLFTFVLMLVCIGFSLYAQAPDTLWTRTYGDTTEEFGYSVRQTSDGGYIIAGIMSTFDIENYDVYLIKTDTLGDTLWTRTYGGDSSDYGRSVQQTNDGGYIIVGETYSFGAGGYDVYLIKTGPESGIDGRHTPEFSFSSDYVINLFNDRIMIKYELPKSCNVQVNVYNMLGQIVRELQNERKDKGKHEIIWDGSDKNGNELPGGIYFLKIQAEDYETTGKIILIR